MSELKGFAPRDTFELKRTGTFGNFSAAGSFPVDYVLTSFDIEDLKHLTFARELVSNSLDFEMMMQRDIDEDRARKELAEYIYPSNKSSTELESNIVFFPPIIVAILRVKDDEILTYYPERQDNIDGDFVESRWGDLFKIKGFSDENLKQSSKLGDYRVQKSPVEIGLNTNSDGAKLVVIDGQHRLFAIKEMLNSDKKSALEDLHLPVCIVFPPNATEPNQINKVPSSTEVFRHLFVDVNATMEQVGGHFTILLKDNNISSVAIRKLCDKIIRDSDYGRETLSAIEWNTKSKKDATVLTKRYSVTSIGIIEKALSETIGNSQRVINYVLDNEVEIEWENFDLSQRASFDDVISRTLVERIYTFIMGIDVYRSCFDKHVALLNAIEEKACGTNNSTKYKIVHKAILNATTIPSDEKGIIEDIYAQLLSDSQQFRKNNVTMVINYALFQRAFFSVWYTLLTKLRSYYNAEVVTDFSIIVINKALKDELGLLSLSNKFCQYNIWLDGGIKKGEGTKKNIHDLIIGNLSGLNVREILLENNMTHENIDSVVVELEGASEKALNDYFVKYKENRQKSFQVEYVRSSQLTEDEIEELDQAKRMFEISLAKVKAGKIDKADIDYTFEKLVSNYVSDEVEEAIQELRNLIGFDLTIVN